MNEEIKEILEIFKQVDLEPEAGGCYNCPKKDKDKTCIGCLNNAKDKLLDYITNLQQENERLSRIVTDYDETLGRVENEYEKLREKNKMLQEDAWRNNADLIDKVKEELEKTDCEECEICEDYKSRIEKAVEFINKHKKEITKEEAIVFNEDRQDKSKLEVGTFMWHVDDLLNILNGRSDE